MSEKYLTPEELNQLAIEEKENQILILELKIRRLEEQNEQMQISLLNAQYKLKNKVVQEKKKLISDQESKVKKHKVKVKRNTERLKKKYKLKESWGFNPDTGEIIQD